MSLFVPLPWDRQPPSGAPYAEKLSLTSLILPGQDSFDHVSRQLLNTRSGTITPSVGEFGRQLSFTANQSSVYTTASPKQQASTQGSIVWAGTFLGTPSTDANLAGTTFNASNGIPYVHLELKRLRAGGSETVYVTWGNGSAFPNLASDNLGITTGNVVAVATVAANSQLLLLKINGALYRYTSTDSRGITAAASTSRIEIGDSLNARNPNAACAVYADADVAWPEAQARSVLDDLWGRLFEPRRIFVPMAAAGGGFTLDLEAGSYSYTGQSTDLSVGRKLVFDAGSYSYSGQTTGLSYGRKLSLDAGSYSYTGQATGIAVSRKLSLDAGSYSYTGNDVTLFYDSSTDTYTLDLEAGSYSYTGQTADLKVARKLVFDAGSYAYTGQTTSFAVARKLGLDAGSYAYTGQTTAFAINRKLALDSGAYTYTGHDPNLAYSGSTGFVTIKAGSWLRYRVI